jgi:hypothetical protein
VALEWGSHFLVGELALALVFAVLLKGTRYFHLPVTFHGVEKQPFRTGQPCYSDYHWGLIAANGAAAVEEEAFCVMTPLDDL